MHALIAGGGVAGAATACLLGPAATLIERETAPHDKICGEFLSWEAQAYLARLGLDPASLGAHPITHIRLVHQHRMAHAALPFTGMGLSRRVLDEALLAHAASRGATILRGHTIRAASGTTLDVTGLGTLSAPRLYLATGKHDLRGLKRDPAGSNPLVGLKMYYRLTPAQHAQLAGHIEILLFPGGYAGLQLIEGGRANLCLLLHRDHFQAAGREWPGVVAHITQDCPHLAARLAGAVPLLDRPLAISGVPYGYVHPTPAPGLFRLGDQMGVIPSFCGDGVSIALHTAFAAAAAGPDAALYHRQVQPQLTAPIRRAGQLFGVAQAAPAWVTAAARLWPGALRTIARLTRLSPNAVVHAGATNPWDGRNPSASHKPASPGLRLPHCTTPR